MTQGIVDLSYYDRVKSVNDGKLPTKADQIHDQYYDETEVIPSTMNVEAMMKLDNEITTQGEVVMIQEKSIEAAMTLEKVLIGGDLKDLTPEERVIYYKKTCDSLNLNYLTKPFEYITLKGKLTLYARKDATEQLRKVNKVSITNLETKVMEGGVYVVTAHAKSADGREDVATGVVSVGGLRGDSLANAFMTAETKAKRRVTLSICGLGMIDESELETIDSLKDNKQQEYNSKKTIWNKWISKIEETKNIDELKNVYIEFFNSEDRNQAGLPDLMTKAKDKKKESFTLKIENAGEEDV